MRTATTGRAILCFLLSCIFIMLTHVQAEMFECDVNGDDRLGLEEAIYFMREISDLSFGNPVSVLACGEPTFQITDPGNLTYSTKRYILYRRWQIQRHDEDFYLQPIRAVKTQGSHFQIFDNTQVGLIAAKPNDELPGEIQKPSSSDNKLCAIWEAGLKIEVGEFGESAMNVGLHKFSPTYALTNKLNGRVSPISAIF